MLARHPLPAHYLDWNRRWGAPKGRQVPSFIPQAAATFLAKLPRIVGPFAYQLNNETRLFEYPWAYFAISPRPGLCALEIGGGLSGMQFVLAREGVDVTNVDPGEASSGVGWPVDAHGIAWLNRAMQTAVTLIPETLQGANLSSNTFDVVYCISTIEHIAPAEHPSLMKEIARVLKPGGRCVLTVDLFLNLAPFTDRAENEFGVNVNIAALAEWSGLSVVFGERTQLLGFAEFSPKAILADLEHTLFGAYPALAQCLVLSKLPGGAPRRSDGGRR